MEVERVAMEVVCNQKVVEQNLMQIMANLQNADLQIKNLSIA